MEPYYYSKLTKQQQTVCHAMLQGITELADSFLVPKTEGKELADLFFRLRLDHPEIFWASGFHYKYYQDSPNFICENVRYDKLKKSYSHEIIGPLGQGVGVCEGIAKAVKALCDRLGIWCIIAICGNNPQKGIKYRHTWNIVKIGGTYYHLDATFDNTLGKHGLLEGGIRYDYFNLDDRAVFRDHEPLIAPAPPCTDGEHFYYKEKKQSFTKMEEVYKRASQAAKKGKPLTFHWRGGDLTREVLEELVETMKQAGAQREKTARIALNWPQAVIRLTYVDGNTKSSVTVDEANEGELEQENEGKEGTYWNDAI